jgi:hypothetical protein
MSVGIQNLKEVVDLVLVGHKIAVQAQADGKIDFADAALLMQLIPVVSPALAGIDQVVPEALDLDAAEGVELVAHVAANLAVENEKAKAIIVEALKFAVQGVQLAKAIKG